MRMIRSFINAMVLLVRLKKERRPDEARALIHQTWEDLFGLPAETIDSLSEQTLMAMVKNKTVLNVDTCVMVARLYKETGDIAALDDRPDESYRNLIKSLNVYLDIALDPSVTEETFHLQSEGMQDEVDGLINPHRDVEELARQLASFILPVPTRRLLFKYYEKYGFFGRAEDLLFDLLEHDRSDLQTISDGHHFYRRLLRKEDAELTAGNLPRAEVEDGLRCLPGI